MGIHGLSKLIADVAPTAIKEVELKTYFGRRIAIDASMSLYQFLIAIRHQNNVMTNEAGETTSHIVGFFYRTCKLLEAGIKPIYVFDGKPPQLKSGELEKRKAARIAAESKLEQAAATDVVKFEKRLVRVTRHHNDDVKKLLRLMGLPVIESPSEAEAQCAQLAKEGLVYAVATEDMDALTFGAPRLIRQLSSGTGDKVKEMDLAKALTGLQLNQEQFIDLCILMGCDYCDSIKGVGPKKGLDLIRKFSTIENILREKYNITSFVDDVQVFYRDRNEKKEDDNIENKKSAGGEPESNGKELKSEDAESEKANSGSDIMEKKVKPAAVKKKTESAFEKVRAKINEVVDEEVKKWEEGDDASSEGAVFPGLEDSDKEAVTDSESDDDEEEEAECVPSSSNNSNKSNGSKEKKKPAKKGTKQVKNEAANVPENWLFKGARVLFQQPNVLSGHLTESDLRIREVDESGLIEFLVKEHAFSEERVIAALKRIKAFKQKSSQSRIDSFFKTVPKDSSSPTKSGTTTTTTTKRKNEATKKTAVSAVVTGKRGRRPK